MQRVVSSAPRRSVLAKAGPDAGEKKTVVQDQKDLTGDEGVFKPFDEVGTSLRGGTRRSATLQ